MLDPWQTAREFRSDSAYKNLLGPIDLMEVSARFI